MNRLRRQYESKLDDNLDDGGDCGNTSDEYNVDCGNTSDDLTDGVNEFLIKLATFLIGLINRLHVASDTADTACDANDGSNGYGDDSD